MSKERDQWIKENMADAIKATAGSGIFPETLLTQAILESQGPVNGVYIPGQADLAKKYNNYFGIQADSSWTGTKIRMTDKNAQGQVYQTYFRTYRTKYDSFKDYVKFLQTNPRYKKAFLQTNASDQLKAIAQAGYAEAPNYTTLLLSVLSSVKKNTDTYTASAGSGLLLAFALAAIFTQLNR